MKKAFDHLSKRWKKSDVYLYNKVLPLVKLNASLRYFCLFEMKGYREFFTKEFLFGILRNRILDTMKKINYTSGGVDKRKKIEPEIIAYYNDVYCSKLSQWGGKKIFYLGEINDKFQPNGYGLVYRKRSNEKYILKYRGSFKNGKKHGEAAEFKWSSQHKVNFLQFEGIYEHDKKEGRGRLHRVAFSKDSPRINSSRTIVGDWMNDEMDLKNGVDYTYCTISEKEVSHLFKHSKMIKKGKQCFGKAYRIRMSNSQNSILGAYLGPEIVKSEKFVIVRIINIDINDSEEKKALLKEEIRNIIINGIEISSNDRKRSEWISKVFGIIEGSRSIGYIMESGYDKPSQTKKKRPPFEMKIFKLLESRNICDALVHFQFPENPLIFPKYIRINEPNFSLTKKIVESYSYIPKVSKFIVVNEQQEEKKEEESEGEEEEEEVKQSIEVKNDEDLKQLIFRSEGMVTLDVICFETKEDDKKEYIDEYYKKIVRVKENDLKNETIGILTKSIGKFLGRDCKLEEDLRVEMKKVKGMIRMNYTSSFFPKFKEKTVSLDPKNKDRRSRKKDEFVVIIDKSKKKKKKKKKKYKEEVDDLIRQRIFEVHVHEVGLVELVERSYYYFGQISYHTREPNGFGSIFRVKVGGGYSSSSSSSASISTTTTSGGVKEFTQIFNPIVSEVFTLGSKVKKNLPTIGIGGIGLGIGEDEEKRVLAAVYKGMFRDGRRDGMGKIFDPLTFEMLFQGEFYRGRKHGRGVEYKKRKISGNNTPINFVMYRGRYENGQKQGVGEYFNFEEMEYVRGMWKNDQLVVDDEGKRRGSVRDRRNSSSSSFTFIPYESLQQHLNEKHLIRQGRGNIYRIKASLIPSVYNKLKEQQKQLKSNLKDLYLGVKIMTMNSIEESLISRRRLEKNMRLLSQIYGKSTTRDKSNLVKIYAMIGGGDLLLPKTTSSTSTTSNNNNNNRQRTNSSGDGGGGGEWSKLGIVMEWCKISLAKILFEMSASPIKQLSPISSPQSSPNSKMSPRRRRKGSVLSINEKIRILYEIAKGVQVLHTRGIAHRDLKFANCLLSFSNEIKLCDFETLAEYEASWDLSGQKLTSKIGTCEFVAPEITLGKEYGLSVDIYSYGMMIYSILAEQYPYQNTTKCSCGMEINRLGNIDFHVANHHLRPQIDLLLGSTPSPKTTTTKNNVPPFPSFLVMLMKQCWSANPTDRPTFDEIIEIFESENAKYKKKMYSFFDLEIRMIDDDGEEEGGEKKKKHSRFFPVQRVLLLNPGYQQIIDRVEKQLFRGYSVKKIVFEYSDDDDNNNKEEENEDEGELLEKKSMEIKGDEDVGKMMEVFKNLKSSKDVPKLTISIEMFDESKITVESIFSKDGGLSGQLGEKKEDNFALERLEELKEKLLKKKEEMERNLVFVLEENKNLKEKLNKVE